MGYIPLPLPAVEPDVSVGQQGDAGGIENGTGFIREEEKGLDFSATLGDDFKIAKDKETQKECVEIKLQGT